MSHASVITPRPGRDAALSNAYDLVFVQARGSAGAARRQWIGRGDRAELLDRVDADGAAARERVGPDLPVAVLLDNPADTAVTMLATAAAGGVCCPLDATAPDIRLAAIVRALGAGVAVAGDTTAPLARADDARGVAAVNGRVHAVDGRNRAHRQASIRLQPLRDRTLAPWRTSRHNGICALVLESLPAALRRAKVLAQPIGGAMARSVGNHRIVSLLEPSRGVGTLLYSVIALVLVGVFALERYPALRPRAMRNFDVPNHAIPFLVAFAALTVLAAVYSAGRWYTQRRIVRMSRDPAVGSLLPPVEIEPAGPFAPPQPRPSVNFDRAPRFFGRIPARNQVTRERNVLGEPPLQIVYLRAFDIRPRARTFARGAWREFGYLHLLRSAASVSPLELARQRRAGRLDDLFVSTTERMRRMLDQAAREPQPPGLRWLPTIAGSGVVTFDRYGAYPVLSLLCHGDFWTTALDILLERADLVVLDLSGYRQHFKGTQFELQRIVDTVPVERVILLADPFSSRAFLREQLEAAWDRMSQHSPNTGSQRHVQGYVTDWYLDEVDEKGAVLRRTLRASRRQSRWLLARVQRLPHDGRSRQHDSHDRQPAPIPPPPSRRWVTLAFAVVLLAALVGGGYALALADDGNVATVVPTTGYNVRSGPSARSSIITVVSPGQRVVVDCIRNGWVRLVQPAPGGYVSQEGLRLENELPRCPS